MSDRLMAELEHRGCAKCGREYPSGRECPVHGSSVAKVLTFTRNILVGAAAIAIGVAAFTYAIHAQGKPDLAMAAKDLQINDMQLQHLQDMVNASLTPLQSDRAKICAVAGFVSPPGCSMKDGKIVANVPPPVTQTPPQPKK